MRTCGSVQSSGTLVMRISHLEFAFLADRADSSVLELGLLAELPRLGDTETVLEDFANGLECHTSNLGVTEVLFQ